MPHRLPEIFILRHGETTWNAEGRFQGHLDSPLTPRGMDQARAMGQALARLGVSGTSHHWISSPAPRAVHTATLARGTHPDTTDDRLLEIGMGAWSGLTRTQIDASWPGPAGEDLMAFYSRTPKGESFAALAARTRAVLADITTPAVIVTHGITSRFLRGAILGLSPDRLGKLEGGHGVIFRCVDGSVTVAARSDDLPDAATGDIAAP